MLKVFCDGGARGNPGPAASGFVVVDNEKVIYKDSKFLGVTTNNVAEYQAVLFAMEWLTKNYYATGDEVLFILDSELVAKQLSGRFKIKNQKLKELFLKVRSLENEIRAPISYKPVPRTKNRLADFLVNRTLDENL